MSKVGSEHRLLYETYPKQKFFLESKARFNLFVAGIGSGKTQVGVYKTLMMPPCSRGAIIAPTYKVLRDATLETFMEIAEPMVDTFNKADMELTLTNGTHILLRSADNPENLRGPNLGWFWLDEAAIMKEMTFDIMIGRLRRQPAQAWVTTTPKGFDYLWRIWVKENGENPDYYLVRAATWENIFLPDGYVESLRAKYSGGFARQEIEGEFCDWGRHAVYEFNRARNVVKGLKEKYFDPLKPLCLFCDFNYLVKPWGVGQIVEVNGKQRPMIFDEIVVRMGSINDAVQDFRNLYPAHPSELQIYGDAAGRQHNTQTTRTDYQTMYEGFRGYPGAIRLMVPASNPPVKDRINNTNRILRGEDVVGPLQIDDRCEFYIEDFMQTQWHPNGRAINKVTDPEDPEAERSHATDAAGYWLFRLFPFVRPVIIQPPKKKATVDFGTVGDVY
jgi:hypothetical protein